MLQTIAAMHTGQLNDLLAGFPKSANIQRGTDIITVYAPNGKKVLSAATSNGKIWHVMAVQGLVSTQY